MLVVLAPGASKAAAERVVAVAAGAHYRAEIIGVEGRWAVSITGGAALPDVTLYTTLPDVVRVEPMRSPYFLASRWFRDEPTVVDVDGIAIGSNRIVMMAGPCAVENEESLFTTAERVQKAGVQLLRAGAYKPRTSPWAFQGLEQRGLDLLADVKRSTGLRIVTEVVSEETLSAVAAVADLIQIGARSMKSYDLLKRVGKCGRPVLLKRAPDAQIGELLASADYLLAAGAPGVVLCERGVCGFADHARNTLDLAAVPALRLRTHLPIVVDPSHGTGVKQLVGPMSLGAVAVGADGLLVEVHARPERALSDGPQALRPDEFDELLHKLRAIAEAVGRTLI